MKKMISPVIAAVMIALVIKKAVVVIIALHLLVAPVLVAAIIAVHLLAVTVLVAAMLCLCRNPRPYSRYASHRSY
jgi:hypothetical protein